MIEIADRYITSPAQTPGDDGLGFWSGEEVYVHDCYIDLQDNPISELDESLGITNGAFGSFERCVIRGAAKLILIGSGDDAKVELEREKVVRFKNCIFEQAGRRLPEVQDGMICYLENCLIQDWGMKSRFKDRNFGAWAHRGGSIFATNCVFRQKSLKRGACYWLADMIGHIGQAVNDDGPKALFSRKTYLPGVMRALTADSTGYVQAKNCWKSHPQMLIENHSGGMSDRAAHELIDQLEQMRTDLKTRLGIK